MTDYWKTFWLSQAKESQDTEQQAQVLRTLNKQPIAPDVFAAIVDSIVTILEPRSDNDLLDLCCGNGVITRELSGRVKTITAVDLSKEFVSQLDKGVAGNITAFVGDARTIEFSEKSFDRILCYAGIQYLSESETVDLFVRMRKWVRDGGLVVLGDIPDAARRWNFFNSPERESLYFDALRVGEPIVGYWFELGWIERLAHHAGFLSAVAHMQPLSLPYQHYRFDLVLTS
jgi:cyclopropane fatty-acyl-phospholipid synthase-like methyltransferase